MKILLKLWTIKYKTIVEKGKTQPTIIIEGFQVPKWKDNWDENEMKMELLNAEAMNVLVCALHTNDFNSSCNCETGQRNLVGL